MSDEFEDENFAGEESEKTEIDIGVLREMSRNVFSDPMACYREMIANSLDEYEMKDDKGNPVFKDEDKKVFLTIDPLRHRVECLDLATGIPDNKIRDFKKVGTGDTLGITGKVVGKEVSSYLNVHDTIQGQKHMGKLAFSEASEDNLVYYMSNNGENGMLFRYKNFEWKGPIYKNTNKWLEHIGLKVLIPNAKREVTNVRIATDRISKWFGLRIAHKKAKIYVRNSPTAPYIPVTQGDLITKGEETIDYLVNKTPIRANIRQVEAPKMNNIDIYCKGVYIKPMHMDYKGEGYIDCKDLELDPGREKFRESQDTHYPEFIMKVEQYLAKNFEKQTSKPEKKMQNKKLKQDVCVKGAQIFAEIFPQFSDLLVGVSIPAGIPAKKQKTEDLGEKLATETLKNIKVIPGGDPNNANAKIYGPNPRPPGPIIHKIPVSNKPGGNGPMIESEGDYTAVRPTTAKIQPDEMGNIRPSIETLETERPNQPGSFIEKAHNRLRIIFNLARPSVKAQLGESEKNKKKTEITTSTLFARAMIDYAVESSGNTMTLQERGDMYDKLLDAMLDKPGESELS